MKIVFSFRPDSAALKSAKNRSNDEQSFAQNILSDCIPRSYSCGATSSSIMSYYPKKHEAMAFDDRKNLVKALRLSRKLENKEKMKILVKICRDRSTAEIEEIKNEDEVQCLPSDIKDFILQKTPTPPDNIIWC